MTNVYEIHLNGNPSDLKDALDQTNLFQLVEVVGYMTLSQAGGCKDCGIPHGLNDGSIIYELDLPQYPCAWEITQGNPEITVAVVDSDFNENHIELKDNITSLWGVPYAPTNECAWHGTAVAGVIIAKHNNNEGIAGVAPGVKVAGYRIPTNGSCPELTCTGNPWPGVWQAYLDGHSIINLSWGGIGGGTAGITIVDAITEMTESGVILIVAAGNRPGLGIPPTCPQCPIPHEAYSDIPGVINVSSATSDGSPDYGVTLNQFVDVCAPGTGVGVVWQNVCGNDRTIAWGTSFAAPNVAGAVALIKSVNSCLLPAEVEAIIEASACELINNAQPNNTGAGYLNAYGALQMAQGYFGSITASDTWDGVNYASDDVIVENDVILTINGEVKFAEGKRLIIKERAKVILNGKLTSSCANPWGGVHIEGDNSISQYIQNQHGLLKANTASVIENAEVAVNIENGGKVYARGSTFLNNGIGIKINPYNNFWPYVVPVGQLGNPAGYFSNVRDCIFKVDDNYENAKRFNAFIELTGIRGIPIYGSDFINERSIKNPTGYADYGYGIKATDARFYVQSIGIGPYPFSSYDNNVFDGLGYGIYIGSAQNPNNNGTPGTSNDDFINLPYTIRQAVFTDCIIGIHNRFVSQGNIVLNTFNMGNLPPASPLSGEPFTNDQVGVFLENGANGFEFQENLFKKIPGNVSNTLGTYSQNLGWFNNVIRRNTYDGVKFGNLAENDNAQFGSFPIGLTYFCNENTTESNDFYVYEQGDIRFWQGEILFENPLVISSTGNNFTKVNQPRGDFDNLGSNVLFFWNSVDDRPDFFNNLILEYAQTPGDCSQDYCIPPCRTTTEIEVAKSTFNTKSNIYNQVLTELDALVSVGNTTDVDNKRLEAGALRNQLDELSYMITSHLVVDTITYDLAELRDWWSKMKTPTADYILARDFLQKGEIELAFSLIDNMESKFDLIDKDVEINQNFRKVMSVIQGKNIPQLVNSDLIALEEIANQNQGVASAWAKNILTLHGYHFPPIIKAIPIKAEERSANFLAEENHFTKPFPNPSHSTFTFPFDQNFEQNESISIEIFNLHGRLVWSIKDIYAPKNVNWDASSLSSGVYLYKIWSNDQLIQSDKLILIK